MGPYFGLAGVDTMVAGILLSKVFEVETGIVLIMIGLLVAFPVSIVAHLLLFHCPWCRGNWSPLIAKSGFLRPVDPRFHFCPYCGHDIDQEVMQ
jgi:hypothetical protein